MKLAASTGQEPVSYLPVSYCEVAGPQPSPLFTPPMSPVPFELWAPWPFSLRDVKVEWKANWTKDRPGSKHASAQLARLWAPPAIMLESRQGVPEEASAQPGIAQHSEDLLPHSLLPLTLLLSWASGSLRGMRSELGERSATGQGWNLADRMSMDLC